MTRAALIVVAVLATTGLGGLASCTGDRASTPVAPWTGGRRPGGLDPIEPGTRDRALLDATRCASCHPAEQAEWAKSRHAAAWTNGIFQREYRDVPRQWCVHCHAPLTPQLAEVVAGGVAPLADQGVSCAACHVRDGRLVARRRGATSPHDTDVRADFGGQAFCADCHQFTFPIFGAGREPIGVSPHPMQDTVAQVRAGPFSGRACLDCHGSPANHRFPGAHDRGILTAAVEHALCRDGDGVILSLRNAGAGHDVPTGDVHRHMVARLWRATAPEALAEIFLGRRFEDDPAGGKRTTWDSAIPPQTTVAWRFPIAMLGGEPADPIDLELRYVYTVDEAPRPHRDPGEPTSVVMAASRTEVGALPMCTAATVDAAIAASP